MAVTLLIVEDSTIQREVLRRMLAKAGYDVAAARDGQEGLELARERHPALVISDIAMPVVDGYEMCRRIKQDPALRTTRVMLLTELSDPREILRGLESGADNYLTKPYEEHDLLQRIAGLLAQARVEPAGEEEGLAVSFAGEEHTVSSNRQQILNLLLSTYENAVQRNRELLRTQLELKKLNEQLEERVRERTHQLELANRAKNAFMANMSHELRTPLNAVIGMTELALNTALDDQQRGLLEIVRRSGESLLDLVNNLLEFARLEAGDHTLQLAFFDLRGELSRLCRPYADRATEHGLSFCCMVHGDVPHHVGGDLRKVRGILCQLLDNAVKFTERGRIHLDVAPVKWEERRVWLRFSVEDSGVGIGEEGKAQVFESFTQGDGSFTRKYGGTGLGLSLARRLAHVLGGEVNFASVEGLGSVFYLQAPFQIQDEDQPGPADRVELLFDCQPVLVGGGDEAQDLALAPPEQRLAEVERQLARFSQCMTSGRTDLLDAPIQWLKRAALALELKEVQGEVLRLAMAGRKADHDKAKLHMEAVRRGFREKKE